MTSYQRHYPRYPLLLCVDPGGGWSGWTENISEAGLFVMADDAPAVGESCTVTVGLPGVIEPFELSGSVAWVRPTSTWQPSGYGIALSEESSVMKRLAQVCDTSDAPSRSLNVLLLRLAFGAGQVGTGIELVACDDGESAIRCAREQAGTVIITSMFPPLSDCLSTLKELRRASVASVFCIASGDADDEARVLAAGADVLLPRPLSIGPLLTSIACLLRL